MFQTYYDNILMQRGPQVMAVSGECQRDRQHDLFPVRRGGSRDQGLQTTEAGRDLEPVGGRGGARR